MTQIDFKDKMLPEILLPMVTLMEETFMKKHQQAASIITIKNRSQENIKERK